MGIDLEKNEVEETIIPVSEEGENAEQAQSMFSHPFSFHGRIRRLEFGLSYIAYFICMAIIGAISEDAPFIVVLIIPLVWFRLAQLTKRFHDRNLSGMHILTLFIPLYNILFFRCNFLQMGTSSKTIMVQTLREETFMSNVKFTN